MNNITFWLEYIYAFIPKNFSRDTSSNTYKIILTIANELLKTFNLKDEVKSQIPITTATDESLDKHAIQFGLVRTQGETDEELRQRIINSFIKSQLTKNNIMLVSDLILPDIDKMIEEPIYDRWFLTPLVTDTKLNIIFVDSSDYYTITVDNNIYEIEGIWLQSDINHTGTNYASTLEYMVEGEVISLDNPLPLETTPVEVWYRELLSQPKYQYSWLELSTILYPRNLNNNLNINDLGVSTAPIQTPSEVMWKTESSPGTQVQILYFNQEYLIEYSWETTVDSEGYVIINNSVKTSDKISDELRESYTSYVIYTNEPIANLQSIIIPGSDIEVSLTDAIVSRDRIELSSPLPSEKTLVRVTYTKDVSINYATLSSNFFLLTGLNDPKNTVYIWLKTDNVLTDSIKNLSTTIRNNTAAGVLIYIGLISSSVYYNQFLYNQGYYGGQTNPTES